MIKYGTVASQIADSATNAQEQKKIASQRPQPKTTEEFIAQYLEEEKRKARDGVA